MEDIVAIYRKIDRQCHEGKLPEINQELLDIMENLDWENLATNELDIDQVVTYLTCSNWCREHLPSRSEFYAKCEKALGKEILQGLE